MPQSQLSRWLLTRKEKDYLINGYIRCETDNLLNFHSVLIEVVRSFYNNLRCLQINGSNFHDFLDEKKPMVTQRFQVSNDASCKNILFRMGIHPEGMNPRKKKDDAIEFYVKLAELPSIAVPVGNGTEGDRVPPVWRQKRDRLYTLEDSESRHSLNDHDEDTVSRPRPPSKWRNARNWNLRNKSHPRSKKKGGRKGMLDRVKSILSSSLSLDESTSHWTDGGAVISEDGASRSPSASRAPSPSPSPSPSIESMKMLKVQSIEIYFELYCQETQCEWKGVTMMTLNEYIVWSPFMMRLSECNQFGSLFFSSDIEVLSLHFGDGRMKPVANPTWMNKNEFFEWNIDDEFKLKRIYGAATGATGHGQCYFSPNFGGIHDDNWCCKWYPEGVHRDDDHGAIFLCLLRKPLAVKQLRVRYRIEFGGGGSLRKVVEEEKMFCGVTRSNGEWMTPISKTRAWGKALQFRIEITILELYGHDNKLIDCNQWTRAGVTRLKPF